MNHYVIQWAYTPGYAEFVGVPADSIEREVVAADTVPTAILAALLPDQPHDPAGLILTAVWQIGQAPCRDAEDRLLEAYFQPGEDGTVPGVETIAWLGEDNSEWYWLDPGPGSVVTPLTVVVWGYDPRYDHTDESAAAPRL